MPLPQDKCKMVLVIHSTWCRDEETSSTPFFFVWGENDGVELKNGGIPSSSSSATANDHPFQSSGEQLSKAYSAIITADQHLHSDSNQKAHSSVVVSFLLPTTANGVPQLSSAQAVDDAASLRQWKIKGVKLEPKEAIPFLLRVSDSIRNGRSSIVAEGDEEIRLGSDLLYWSKAAKFLLELIARQRFVPYFSEENSPHYRSTWLLAPTDEDDSSRLEHLAGEMPPICRAASREDPHSLLTECLNHSADIMIRQFVEKASAPILDAESEAAAWYNGLFAPESPKVAAKVGEGLVSWADEVLARGSPTDHTYRTCFRLEAPPPDGGKRWSLEYLVQSLRDPSLIIPAESVWNEKKSTAQERLLSDLAKASRFFKPIDSSLESSPAPTCGKLTIDEAYSFLKESAWLLRESGFGIQIPHWLEEGTRLKIQLNVKSSRRQNTKAGEGGLFTITNLAKFDWKIAVSGQNGEVVLSEEEFMALAALKQPIVEFRGEWVELRKEDVDSALRFLENQKKQGGIHMADLVRFASAPESQSLAVEIASCDGWISEVIGRLKKKAEESIADIPAPKHFVGILRPYQLKGFSWLEFMGKWGLGACLADDMGLGKTIQFIALLLRYREEESRRSKKPSLLICPTSIVGNWKRELERFSPSIRALIHHGSARISDAVEFAKSAKNFDVVISTYSLIQRDVDLLSAIEWRTVVLDEAQNVKNHWTKQAQAVRKLKSEHRVALTGTPIENRLSELWSIMDFLNPGYLGSFEEFRRKYSVPVERYGDDNTQRVLQKIVQPFILRRLKTDTTIITDLPKKNEMKVFCSLTEEQASLYEAHVTKMLQEIEASEGIQRRGLVLSALTRLKQICDHPALYLADRSSLASRSGKLERLKEMLEEVVEEKEKALVFTQFSQMGTMIKLYLERETGYEVPFLYGGVPRKKRDEMVARFQEDSPSSSYLPVFVISLKAGGLGLNLTAANHVFHYDRWWNPAVENQATDRAFRIGQKRNVQVHKFVSAGTLEEMIDAMIERKKGLAENILGTGEQWLTELSTRELRDMLVLRRE
ncbi:MAG: DEAD/DEAH box helicase [Nitrososphaerales archaeon]